MAISKKTGLTISIAILAMVTIGLLYMFVYQPFVPLVKGESEEQIAELIAGLNEAGVEYTFSPDGKTILVKEDRLHEVRYQLKAKGIHLKNGVGLEIFDNVDYGLTEFAQRINYQRAMQGEIARTIMEMQEIRFARVHLTLPKSALFIGDQEQPKASVTLAMEEGAVLSQQQIHGIQNLVSSSVESLSAANVVILDDMGRPLTTLGQETGGNVVAPVERKHSEEERVENKVAELIELVVPGIDFVVSVDLAFNHDRVIESRESILLDEGAAIRSRTKSTSDSGASKEKGKAAKGASTEVTSEAFDYGRSQKQIEYARGALDRMSIGVVVGSKLSEDTSEQLMTVIAAAVGMDEARGDVLTIAQIPKNIGEKAVVVDEQLPVVDTTGKGAVDEPLNTEERAVLASSQSNAAVEKIGIAKDRQVAVRPLWQEPQWLILGGVGLVVVCFIGYLLGRRGTARLSEREREEALKEIQAWLSKNSNEATS
jgi:flagellar M-ring protein FliF